MAASSRIGRSVVKSSATGESARRAPRRRRKAAAHRRRGPHYAVARRAFSRTRPFLSQSTATRSAARRFFFATTSCGYSRKFCKITRRKRMIHSGRTRLEVSQRRRGASRWRNAAVETRVKVPHVRGGRACPMLSLLRRTADSLPWPPRSAAVTVAILIAAVSHSCSRRG